jgi:hypothetical protein
MKKFSELNVGDEFYSECEITPPELDSYLLFSGIKNSFMKTRNPMRKKWCQAEPYCPRWKESLQDMNQCMATT